MSARTSVESHRSLIQALRSPTLTVDGVLNLGSSCGLTVRCEVLNSFSETSTSISLPSPRCVAGIESLVTCGYFAQFPDGSIGVTTSRGSLHGNDLSEAVCAVIFLFPSRFASAPPTTSQIRTGPALSADSSSACVSLDSSLDGVQPASSTETTPKANAAASACGGGGGSSTGGGPTYDDKTLSDLQSQIDVVGSQWVLSLDDDIRQGLRRMVSAQYTAKGSKRLSASSAKPAAAADHPASAVSSSGANQALPSGEATIAALQEIMAKLYLVKALLVGCLALSATHPLLSAGGGPEMPLLMDDIIQDRLGLNWRSKPLRNLGWSSIALAERSYDDIACSAERLLSTSQTCLPPVRQEDSLPFRLGFALSLDANGHPAIEAELPSGLPMAATPAVSTSARDFKWLFVTSFSDEVMFDVSPSAMDVLLHTATQRKLSASQCREASSLLTESEDPYHRHAAATFFSSTKSVHAVLEKNKELFLAVFRALHQSGSPTAALLLDAVMAKNMGEPSCHVMKALVDEDLVGEEELSLFVSRAVAETEAAAQSSPADASAKAQRNAMMLCLMLNNLFLSKKRVTINPEVQAQLLAFCVTFGKWKACSELYSTITTIKKK